MCMDGDVVDAVDVGGLRIAFQREGRGPPLVLLHGFVGDGVGTWAYQLLEALSDAFTVIAWDGPGAGHSSAAVLALELFRRHRARIVPVGRLCGLSFPGSCAPWTWPTWRRQEEDSASVARFCSHNWMYQFQSAQDGSIRPQCVENVALLACAWAGLSG